MKKLLIKWFKLEPPKRTLVVELNAHNKLHVVEVEKETSSIVEGLGLTKEKEDELVTKAMEAFQSTKNLVECMEKASKHCKHPNELFFISYVISSKHVQNHFGPGALIAKLIMGGGSPQKD